MSEDWIPAERTKFGPPADDERNRNFVREWRAAKHGTRKLLAKKFGFSSYDVAKAIAHNLIRFGGTSGRRKEKSRPVDKTT